ncbi:MAG TPA: hypothetical protein DD671_00965 [Balneolaceae bacterium]|nr:hypothetical protein [Balneola sp.]HBQ58226.1 hypothetical protein [Balneolaceae bacterium]|tara:strand:- start:9465 stop:9713 length:249 start_codon:yes stop_codon:yes gene_type:complete
MKSFFIWIFFVILGVLAGYGVSFLINLNVYLLLGGGVIIGSSLGVTWNIHREREEEFEMTDLNEEESTNQTSSPSKINQKEL